MFIILWMWVCACAVVANAFSVCIGQQRRDVPDSIAHALQAHKHKLKKINNCEFQKQNNKQANGQFE